MNSSDTFNWDEFVEDLTEIYRFTKVMYALLTVEEPYTAAIHGFPGELHAKTRLAHIFNPFENARSSAPVVVTWGDVTQVFYTELGMVFQVQEYGMLVRVPDEEDAEVNLFYDLRTLWLYLREFAVMLSKTTQTEEDKDA